MAENDENRPERYVVESGRISNTAHVEDILSKSAQKRLEREQSADIDVPMHEPEGTALFGYLFKAVERHASEAKERRNKPTSEEEADAKLSILNSFWGRLQIEHSKMLDNAREDLPNSVNERMERAEQLFLAGSVALKRCMREMAVSVSSQKENIVVRMPSQPLDIRNTWGTFDGNIKKWPGFRDRYLAAVHNNAEVPTAYKFQHLRASLMGQAAVTMGEWQLTEANYLLAWERMLQLYDKKYSFCREVLKTFFKLPVLERAPRARDLQRMSNVAHETLRQLKAQGIPVDSWDMIIVHVLHEKLDAATSRQWELARQSETPTANEMLRFIDQQAASMEGDRGGDLRGALMERNQHRREDWKERDQRERGMGHKRQHSIERIPCKCCGKGGHPLWECEDFRALNLFGRKELAMQKELCVNCLKTGHSTYQCYQGPCSRCPNRPMHNSLLCPRLQATALPVGGTTNECNILKGKTNKNKNNYYSVVLSIRQSRGLTILPTVLLKVKIDGNIYGPFRALLDTGAQPNLISSHIIKELRVSTQQISRQISGLGGAPIKVNRGVSIRIGPWFFSDFEIETNFLIVPQDCCLQSPNTFKCIALRDKVGKLNIADPWMDSEKEIGIILGVDVCSKVIQGVTHDTERDIIELKTLFGVVFMGVCGSERGEKSHVKAAASDEDTDKLDDLLQRLWCLDEIGCGEKRSEEEQLVEENFLNTYSRDRDGRFIVAIPYKEGIEEIGSSREIALKRFYMLEKRLERDSEIREQYVKFMKEYESLGHMEAVNGHGGNGPFYYIPHHCVSAKFRVVFDASCKTSKGVSLNDMQMLGEKLQRNLQDIIMRFRRHKIAIVADIKMMFRQVRIVRDQWDLQRIFWRENITDELKEYWLVVNTYGMTSAAHNAVRAMVQCAREAGQGHEKAAEVIEQDMYMDDCTTGADTVHEAILLAKDVDNVLKSGGFELRKWKSNCKGVLRAVSGENEDIVFDDDGKAKVLGLRWVVERDVFTFNVKSPKIEGVVTKRKVVSCIAQLYDPNGFIAPLTILGKIYIQDIWRVGIEWDENISGELLERWTTYWEGIKDLERFEIPRWVGTSKGERIQLHGFSDASAKAYGAVIYVRSTDNSGNVSVALLVAKSRVAPLKTVTIPRLELAAAELLARLVRHVMDTMDWKDAEYTLWTDSVIVLHWMCKMPRDLKTFVANRVSSIQSNTDVKRWRHVRTEDNPADLISRGLLVRDLINNKLWLQGPPWLVLHPREWKSNSLVTDVLDVGRDELKIAHVAIGRSDRLTIRSKSGKMPVIEYAANWEKAVSIMAYVCKYVGLFKKALADCRTRGRARKRRRVAISKVIVPTTNMERSMAITEILRETQLEYFAKEIAHIKEKGCVNNGSRLEPLMPVIGDDGLLRVGGRLDKSDLKYETKHPVIIPGGSRVAWLLVDYAHRMTKHGGVQIMTQFIRERFWIPRIRNELRQHVARCAICARYAKRVEDQLMADLPKDRVTCGKPFLASGVDFAGPVELKVTDKEGNELERQKCWIAVFVCLRTRALHLDIVPDLSTTAFIACFERFIARRGRCERMYSDNGTNFKGAARKLQAAREEWFKRETMDYLGNKGTEWKFMAPAAPHQGGIYEAAVKSMKFHMVRVIGLKVLTYEQLLTLLAGIEAILNSRPLHPLSQDANDRQALTPGHFLVGEPLVLPLPFSAQKQSNASMTEMWREREIILTHFWKRWREEYLSSLQERKKWRREREPLALGQLVLLKSEKAPPAAWALGRIEQLLFSHDGRIRNVVVKTETGRFTRPVQKICVIPMEQTRNGEQA